MSHGELRLLTSADVPAALQLSSLAGWNQTAEDWLCLLELAPDGCFGIQIGDTLAATTTLFCYGKTLAWTGMVLTHPNFRRQGLATRLLKHVLALADERRIATVKLDATEMGEPLYRNFGFLPEQRIERWSRPANSSVPSSSDRCSYNFASWTNHDSDAFGVDRSCLLRALLKRGECYSASSGYLLTRAGKNNSYLGPCIAEDARSARHLVEMALQSVPEKGWCWDILQSSGAFALATELGFAPQRRLLRMARGKQLRGKEELIYATAGFEFG